MPPSGKGLVLGVLHLMPETFPEPALGCQSSKHPTKPRQTMGAVSENQTCSATANLCQSSLVPGGQWPKGLVQPEAFECTAGYL